MIVNKYSKSVGDIRIEKIKKDKYSKKCAIKTESPYLKNVLKNKIKKDKYSKKCAIKTESPYQRNVLKNKIKKDKYSKKCAIKTESSYQRNVLKNLQRKRILHSDIESSESEAEVVTIDTDDSDYANMDEFIEKCLNNQIEYRENINPCDEIPFGLSEIIFYDDNSNNLKKDDWLVVQFATKKNLKHFVGTILSFQNQMPIVKYVRKVKQSRSDTVTSFTYPIVEDISVIKHKEDIVCILPKPIISRRS
ncbi:hypothetical protein ACJJTC_016518 [Scirpophaga incertulas]